jgi:phosphomannomutase
MEIKPKLSVTGYRAIWGKDLNEQIAFEYALSFAKMIAGSPSVYNDGRKIKKILIGRDARQSGPMIHASVQAALEKEDLEITYAGILPTPSMLLLVKKLNFDGGVMITASHNPIEYNGVKFIVPGGRLTNAEETAVIQKNYNSLTEQEKVLNIETLKILDDTKTENQTDNSVFRRVHIDEILKNIDVELIKSKHFRVALDPVNSGGSLITQELLKELGCTVHVINSEMTGLFAHRPEPLPENLGQIARATKESGSDIGFAQDPDADRLVVVNEHGVVISEEMTLVLAIKNVLSKESGDIVINLSTSRMGEDLAESMGRKVYRTKIGEANVVQKLLEAGAPIGGEGSSGAIYPRINTARDSLVGISLVLELLARENKTVSELADSLPKYFMKKENFRVSMDLVSIYAKLKEKFKDAKINELDGIKFDFEDKSWIHIRPSNTEPLVRVFGEAKTQDRIDTLFREAKLTFE